MKTLVKLIIIAFYLTVCACQGGGEYDIADISVEISSKAEEFGLSSDIRESITLYLPEDTLRLSLQNIKLPILYIAKSGDEFFMVKNLAVKSAGKDIPYSFDGQTITIPDSGKLKKIDLDFKLILEATFMLEDTTAYKSLALMNGDWSSWHFSTGRPEKLMVKIYHTPEVKSFYGDNTIIAIRKDAYDQITVDSGKNLLQNYSRKQLDDRATAKEAELRKILASLETYFPEQKGLDISIIDNNTGLGGYVFGQTIETADNDYCILVDTSGYSNGVLAHEMTHVFTPKVKSEAPGYYVLSESLIEYLSIYILNRENTLNLDSLMLKKAESIDGKPERSLLDLDGDRTGDNSYILIYRWGPYRIHEFAKQIGYDLFDRIIEDFFTLARKKKGNVTLEDFRRIAEAKGISRETLNDFYSSL